MRKFWQTTWQCATVFLCIVSGIIVASLGPSNQAAPGWLLLHDLYYPWVYLAVFYGLLTLLNRHCWPANWHFTWHFAPRGAGVIAGSLAVIWGLAIWLLTPGHFIAAPAFSSFEFARTLAGFITAVLVTPLIEELAFRGVILARLSANYGARVGLWGSALLFGASHLLNGRFQWQSALLILLAGTAIGLLLALVRATTGTLWASYLVHATFNGLTSLLMAQATPANDWPWTYLLTSHSLLLTGGNTGSTPPWPVSSPTYLRPDWYSVAPSATAGRLPKLS